MTYSVIDKDNRRWPAFKLCVIDENGKPAAFTNDPKKAESFAQQLNATGFIEEGAEG